MDGKYLCAALKPSKQEWKFETNWKPKKEIELCIWRKEIKSSSYIVDKKKNLIWRLNNHLGGRMMSSEMDLPDT